MEFGLPLPSRDTVTMLQGTSAADMTATVLIPVSAVVAIIFGLWLWKRVSAVSVSGRARAWRGPCCAGRVLALLPGLSRPPPARR
jgi:hypothetical protein